MLNVMLFVTLFLDSLRACLGGEIAFDSKMSRTLAFAFPGTSRSSHRTAASRRPLTPLFMGKGFNRAKNKQAELAKKMELARKGKENGEEVPKSEDVKDYQSKDRALFEQLLTTTKGAIPTARDAESDAFSPIKVGYEKKKKVKKPKPPPQPKVEKKAEKVPQRSFFEDLIDIETGKTLGPIDAAKLVPWVPPYLTDCLVIFTDPRTNSGDLRQTFKYMTSTLEDQDNNEKFNQQVIFVCAESVQEMKSWLRRSNIESSLRIFSDPEMKFLSAYEVVGGDDTDYRWSMSMLVFDTDGKKPKVIRDVDPSHASQMALKLMKEYESKS